MAVFSLPPVHRQDDVHVRCAICGGPCEYGGCNPDPLFHDLIWVENYDVAVCHVCDLAYVLPARGSDDDRDRVLEHLARYGVTADSVRASLEGDAA